MKHHISVVPRAMTVADLTLARKPLPTLEGVRHKPVDDFLLRLEQKPSSLVLPLLTTKLNSLPPRPVGCDADELESSRSARRSAGRRDVPKGIDGDPEITLINHPNGSGVGEWVHAFKLKGAKSLPLVIAPRPPIAHC